MHKFKVCMLGSFAVGKTSLVRQFVFSIFSGKYQTTLGVKIDKKSLQIDDQSVELILWDLAGEDDFIRVPLSYLRGSAGAVLVADGTRAETLEVAVELSQKLFGEVGEVPIVLLINKSDLKSDWKIDQAKLEQISDSGWQVIETSAMDAANVSRAFHSLTQKILNKAGK
jgi:small GTP-binding protein